MTDLAALFAETEAAVAAVFTVMEWAEDEIDRAQTRHPAQADRLYHCRELLGPGMTDERVLRVEAGFRSHCRELLERVAGGFDTRPGTATEVCLVCCDSSLSAPLTESAAGLYERMFKQAFPDDHANIWQGRGEHYQGLHGWEIDSLEAKTRNFAARPERVLGRPSCDGIHHGEPAPACPFFDPQGSLDLDGDR